MPFTILRVSHEGDKKKTEVIGEFESEAEAAAFAEDARKCDPDKEYLVEAPPATPDPKPPNF